MAPDRPFPAPHDPQALPIVFVVVTGLVAEYSVAVWLLIEGGNGTEREQPAVPEAHAPWP